MDYQSNSDKRREEKVIPEKKIEKVITGEVVTKPKSISHKFKDIFFGGDVRSTSRYVASEVLLPALRNLVFDTGAEALKRMIFGESMYRRRSPTEYSPRVQYNNPIHATSRSVIRDPRERPALPNQVHPYRQSRREPTDIILSSREEAELVVERLIDIIDKYDTASVADLYDLVGLPTSHVDNKWGWAFLNNVEIRQIREGYLIELPQMEAI